MTDQKDYTQEPEVLEACGVESKNGINVGEGLTIYPTPCLLEPMRARKKKYYSANSSFVEIAGMIWMIKRRRGE